MSDWNPNWGFRIFGDNDTITPGVAWLTVAGAGDINHDGLADLIASAPGALNNTGIVFVIFGGRHLQDVYLGSMNNSVGFRLFGPAQYTFGYSVNGVGDVNNDGIDDIMIGAPAFPFGDNGARGTAYIVFGRAEHFYDINVTSMPLSTGIQISSEHYFGFCVGPAGDLNGDGVNDMFIGEYDSSWLWLLFGSKTGFPGNIDIHSLTSEMGLCITSAEQGWVYSSGDFNDDGIPDWMSYVSNGANGTILLVYGTRDAYNFSLNLSNLTAEQGFIIAPDPTPPNGIFNTPIVLFNPTGPPGDFNNDGVQDICVTDPNIDENSVWMGRAYVIYGSKGGFGNKEGTPIGSSTSATSLASHNSSNSSVNTHLVVETVVPIVIVVLLVSIVAGIIVWRSRKQNGKKAAEMSDLYALSAQEKGSPMLVKSQSSPRPPPALSGTTNEVDSRKITKDFRKSGILSALRQRLTSEGSASVAEMLAGELPLIEDVEIGHRLGGGRYSEHDSLTNFLLRKFR